MTVERDIKTVGRDAGAARSAVKVQSGTVQKTVQIRDMVIGEGMTKTCAPITGVTEKEILDQAWQICQARVDIIEWRCDWFENVEDLASVKNVLCKLRALLGERTLLVTFRTKQEGGNLKVAKEVYRDINRTAIESGCADLVDVEIMMDKAVVKEVIACAHKHGVYVVASNHDFDKTPKNQTLLERMKMMDEAGADILKAAVMPNDAADVVRLLDVTEKAKQFGKPVITMSMAGKGLVSRLSGEVFGSAVTFGCVGRPSAPGQIEVSKLREILELIHESL